ncbi:MAG: hypothetical protein R3A50_13810 [Saprospiraceae bacterium]|nr:hypothetical protein [Saprospiraceae bacterium]MCB9342992.1 hypothetical protein [Lewinellaceae bacterium]
MKINRIARRIGTVSLFLLLLTWKAFPQGIHPQNLFDAGLNIAYMDGHLAKGAQQSEAPIWAGNASAEWLSSWTPGMVTPISPDLDNPVVAHNAMLAEMTKMPPCSQPYFNLRLSIYKLGYAMGHAVVETGYDCSSCLKTEMQKASIELRTIGQFLSNNVWQDLSTELNNNAQGLEIGLQGELAAQQNAGRFGYLQSVLDRLNQLLPDDLILCKEKSEQEETQAETNSGELKKQKRRNRKTVLMGGSTVARLIGDSGTNSQTGKGFFVGLEVQLGKPVFFNGGVDFFRNSAGKEYFVLVPGQIADPANYMQSFRIDLGLGAYLLDQKDLSICTFANLRIMTSTSIGGKYSSYGVMDVQDTPLNLNVGTRVNIKFLTVHLSYDHGLTPMLINFSTKEEFRYRIWHFGLGFNI